MQHYLFPETADKDRLYSDVFPKIFTGETILFLGAGASVTEEKKYLSQEIMDFYSEKKGIALKTNDIIDFVDTLSSTKSFDRNEFDDFVAEMLKKLRPSEAHRTIASIRWKEIITTNYDLLIEKAFDEIENTTRAIGSYHSVRSLADYKYRPANDEFKYVKLNGCLSDKKAFPFVFSTKDFENSKKFYSGVLNSLEDLSPKISFLAVGYSFTDIFAKNLLQRFDKTNFRHKRWLLNLDPYVEDDRLPYFTDNRICVIKSTASLFFEMFKEWEEKNAEHFNNKNPLIIKNRSSKPIAISPRVRQRVNGNLIQIVKDGRYTKITPLDFYSGIEPNYQVIEDDLDVLREEAVNRATSKVMDIFALEKSVIPTLALEGSYGTGKSTLSYRVISNLLKDPETDAIAFEIINPDLLQAADLEEIFAGTNASRIIIFFNGIELDMAFKGLIRLRLKLSMEQFKGFDIIFLASIRENILAQYLKEHEYKNFHTLNVDQVFNESEAEDLIDKLQAAHLVDPKDAKQKDELVKKVLQEYEGDTLVSLISLVSTGTHYQIVRNAYDDLNEDAQKVFLYTSLLYRFGILMPASLLRRLIELSWDDFARDIIPYNFKNFIIRVENNSPGTDPDLYFKTRHPIISNKLVEICLPDEDVRFKQYEFLLRRLIDSNASSNLAINLLKTLRQYDDLSTDKIDRLFDVCGQEFHEDAHFNLHYAINLQYRNDEESLRKGIRRITYAESFQEQRNHRLIHRKAIISYKLAKLLFDKEGLKPKETFTFIDHARDFFEVKLMMDPFSSYSYVDYVKFEIWCLNNFNHDASSKIRRIIKIDDLIDQAEKAVFDDIAVIQKLKADYLKEFKRDTPVQQREYETYIEQLLANPEDRAFGLILSFYHYQDTDPNKLEKLIQDLKEYQYLDDVARILFRYYGRNLHKLENRLSFISLVKKHRFLETKEFARYNYYYYITEIYHGHYDSAYEHLTNLRSKVSYLNPEIYEKWRDDVTGKPKIFEGSVQKTLKGGKWKKIKISELQRTFDIKGGLQPEIDIEQLVSVELHFHLSGVKAVIVKAS